MRGRSTAGRRAWPILVLGLLSSCGAGVAGVVASSGDSGGGTTPALNAFVVESPKESPARLVLDASQAVRVALFFDAGQERPMQLVPGPGVAGNEVSLAAGPNPAIEWDFEADLPNQSGFTENVRLLAKLGGSVIAGGELTLGLGNDAPVVHSVDPMPTDPLNPEESAGNIEIRLGISDTSSDPVDIQVEWRRASDPPDAWDIATAAGVFPDGVETSRDPVELSFFWNTNVDLAEEEDSVLFRVTADDRTDPGTPFETQTLFRVDNNAAPIVQLDSGPLLLNPDERRGIPIPFRVIDEEDDLVEVIFQWRREGEEFPELPTDTAALDAILADPLRRRELHVCTPYPHHARGRVVPIDESTVRLPELASSESWILASGIVGRALELLRPSSIPAPITPTWRQNPFGTPIAALPAGDGLTALVLEFPGNGSLREFELATGVLVREVAALGPGIPSAMAFEQGGKAVLVALDDAGTWRIERVELASGALTQLIVSDGTEPAPVRGIASLGSNAAVFTAGSSLFHLDYRDALAPRLGRPLTDLAAPWGVVVDTLPPNRIYVSERDANRVLAVELDSHARLPEVVKAADMQLGTLEAPEALALERNGARMLIVTTAPGGGHQLLGLDLGATGGNRSFPIGVPTATGVSSVATGSDELRLLCLPGSNELLVAGGIEQRRVIATHSTSSQDVSVEPHFDPAPSPAQPWRLAEEAHRLLRASARGVSSRFVWDSADAFTGLISLRAVAHDDEFGIAADFAAPKRVRGGLEVDALTLGGDTITQLPISVAAPDLDGDGDLDLVSANSDGDDLTVFFQSSGSFASAPSITLGNSLTTNAPFSVAAADLDGDGDLDLVSANNAGNDLRVFHQVSPGNFGTSPALGGSGTTDGPSSVAAADLDGDGDLDLVSANRVGDNLSLFLQLPTGSFAAPFPLGGGLRTNGPISVAAADLDGDGDLDLVSANVDGNNLTVFEQMSPGTFNLTPLPLGDSTTTRFPRSVAAADLDGDGDLDLVSANRGASTGAGSNLTVFFQQSPGSFPTAPSLTVGTFPFPQVPFSVAAADLDGDGDLDLVSANRDGDNLTVFFQLSPGSYATTPLVIGGEETTVSPVSVAAADLDGDGDLDLVSANNLNGGNDLTVFFQGSPGSYGTAPLVLGGTAATRIPASVAAADLDGDGDLDLVFANQLDNNLALFHQLSPGSFPVAPLTLGDSTTACSPRSVAAADLDGDGDLDLVSANQGDASCGAASNLTVFFQEPPGSFPTDPSLTLGSSAPTTGLSVAAADLDGDGDLDLVSANRDGNDLTVFFQEPPGSFTTAPPLTLGSSNGPVSVAVADLDGDGDLDLVSANELGSNLTVFLQTSGSLPIAPSLTLGDSVTTAGPSSVAAADLNGDGDLDLVSANVDGDDLTVFEQLSPGTFDLTPLRLGDSTTTRFPRSVATADVDGDGDLDLVSANELGFDLTVFLQLSPGTFGTTPLRLASGGAFPTSVVATDLDGDGDQDLVLANRVNPPPAPVPVRGNLTVFFGGR